jgi:DNA-directed RNA polymerase subunit RPC12/RpoP
MFKDFEQYLNNLKEQERIRCPYCNFDCSFDGDGFEMYENGVVISFHGWPDQEDQIISCPECEESFKVREHVRRTFDTCKTDEDFE